MRYEKVVERLLLNGTTTANYFATCHVESTKKLAKICDEYGQRAIVGKVSMDQYTHPAMITETQTDVKNAIEVKKNV